MPKTLFFSTNHIILAEAPYHVQTCSWKSARYRKH